MLLSLKYNVKDLSNILKDVHVLLKQKEKEYSREI
jgi:hypothetical protein